MEQMNITSAQYMSNDDGGNTSTIKATINGVEMFIPLSVGNIHYAEILKQVADGDLTIADAE